jgi:8-oxo-dGTP diphosphatase
MKTVHVAVAVIVDQQQQVLIALRKPEQHQGGLWEFPGGKVEPNESVFDALRREINEELSLQINSAEPLIKIEHQYSDKSVLLDVWWVDQFVGTAIGNEGQAIKWCDISQLHLQSFPAANDAIVSAVQNR